MIITRVLLFYLFLFFNLSSFACGTADNWMDAYEGIDSGNKWRDSMNQLESLVMLQGCGGSHALKKEQQERMLRILNDAMKHRFEFFAMPSGNRDIRGQVKLYRGLKAYEGLVESIYRRNHCLQGTHTYLTRQHDNTIYNYFGVNACPGHKSVSLKIKASGGGRLRAWPEGRIIVRLKDGSLVQVLGKKKSWYRVINPHNNNGQDTLIGYLHESIVESNP